MAHLFQKQPENALKSARGLLTIPNVDAAAVKRNKRTALEKLGEALVAKKHRTWQPVHEELMLLYLDLCLDLQLGRIAKDGLHQYRNLAIQTNPASLEAVILHFVKLTEHKLALAKRESTELILQAAAAVDLEAAQTPEAVMLSTTSFDSSSDRTDREVVVPWLRFTWEAYRTVLDILKNNSKLEALYQTVALKAFDFCVEYTRKIEFRRLCEILRNHLGALQKHAQVPTTQSARQMRAWDGFTLGSVERLLEVRYRQLQVAAQLELFSEAFRTIDDINTIMNLVDQVPRLDLLVTYYDKLAHIFLVSKNHLFHAFALYKWYALKVAGLHGLDGALALAQTTAPLVHKDEQAAMATRVVLAALSVPLVDFDTVLEGDAAASSAATAAVAPTSEKHARMAALLGFTTAPTRAQLLEDVQVSGVLARASPGVASLFQRLEKQEIDPLQIVAQVAPQLDALRGDAASAGYADAVERLVVRRVLFQLTRVYSSVTLAHLKSLFVGLRVSYEEIEQLIVRSRSLSTVAHASAPSLTSLYQQHKQQADSTVAAALRTKIRIDHVQQCVRFSEAVELEAHPQQLSLLGERLAKVLAKVPSQSQTQTQTQIQTQLATQTRATLKETRAELLARREIIERKKEELERLQQEKLKSLEKKRAEAEAARLEAEKTRLALEAKRREAERLQKIKDEIALKETRAMLEKIGRTDLDDADLATLDRDALLNEAKEKALKAKEDAQRKLRDAARRLDYIIRATREAEQPILQQLVAQEKQAAAQRHEQQTQTKLAAAQGEHEAARKEKARLAAALPVATAFAQAHRARRQELYKKEAEAHAKKAKLERLERRVAHAKQRYDDEQEEIRAYEAEQERARREEEEQRERERQAEIEAELRRQEEEEAARKEEEDAARKAEEEEQRQRSSSAYRAPAAARRGEDEGGEWTSVRAPRAEGRWERAGPPPSRDGPGLRRGLDRDSEDRSGGGSALDRAFGSAAPRRSFGGDREEREGGGGLRRGFGGDRDGESGGGLRRGGFGGDRDREGEGSGLRRGGYGDRDGEGGGLRRGGFGDRDGEGGGLRRGGFGDRERDGEAGGLRRGGFGGDRDGEGGGLRRGGFGDREREGESGGGLRRGGFGDREREGGEDRFFGGRSREGAYRPPREGEPRREEPRRDTTRAPDSGRWR